MDAAGQECANPPSRASDSYWTYIDACGCSQLTAPSAASPDHERFLKACGAWREQNPRLNVIVSPSPRPSPSGRPRDRTASVTHWLISGTSSGRSTSTCSTSFSAAASRPACASSTRDAGRDGTSATSFDPVTRSSGPIRTRTRSAEVQQLAARACPRPPRHELPGGAHRAPTFAEAFADVVLGSAVLHFARDEAQFDAMVRGLWRVLQAGRPDVLPARVVHRNGEPGASDRRPPVPPARRHRALPGRRGDAPRAHADASAARCSIR